MDKKIDVKFVSTKSNGERYPKVLNIKVYSYLNI